MTGSDRPALSGVTVVAAPSYDDGLALSGTRQVVVAVDDERAAAFERALGKARRPGHPDPPALMTPTVVVLVSTGAAWEARALEPAAAGPSYRRAQAVRRCRRPARHGQPRSGRGGRGRGGPTGTGPERARRRHPVGHAGGRRRDRDRARPATCGADRHRHRARRDAGRGAWSRPWWRRRRRRTPCRPSRWPRHRSPPVASPAASSRSGVPAAGRGGPPSRPPSPGSLARRGLDTLLVDADPHGGSVAQRTRHPRRGIRAANRGPVRGGRDGCRAVPGSTAPALRATAGAHRAPTAGPVVRDPRRRADRARRARSPRGSGGPRHRLLPRAGPGRRPGPALAQRPDSRSPGDRRRGAARRRRGPGRAGPAGPGGQRACTSLRPDPPMRVVVNRMRSSLGWREGDVAAMLAEFGASRGVHFLPDDQAAVDRALVAGRLLLESGDGALTRAVGALLDAMVRR
ncbi:hypothetical protein [Nocardioides convexus]|uniref:hypothetical protein n=1 Tax=Nocardioides convexus TaxID=2712224 RepID=UPI0024188DDA|nr:hypothetical protein [Nocardioides convexus]